MADKTLLVKVRSIFSAAANRVNLVSGEDLEVSLGKISKWFSDLKTVAFTGSYNDLTDKPSIPSSAVTGVKGNSESSYRSGNVNITKSNIGLGSVENKSSSTIRSEITSSNVTSALGYTPVNKAGDTMDGSLTFKDANSNDGGTINAEYDDYFAIEVESGKILLLDGPTEVEGYLQLNIVNRPSTSDNDECQTLGFVVNSDDGTRIGRVVKLYKSDIVTLASITTALGYTPVNKAGDTMSNSLSFQPDTGHLAGIQGPTGTPGILFDDSGSTMYVGRINGGASLITIDSTGIYIDGYKVATLNDIPSASVTGVKGNSESSYRSGNVNITAANIGAVRYDTSSQGLTTTQKSNARKNLGLGSAATYSSSSFASSTQGEYATDFNSNFKPIFATSGQSHASVFRGKYLGSSFTSAQKTAIANGTFDDLFVGDYWTIGGVNWRIADIDYYIHHGDTECTTHHIVIVPDSSLTTSAMNSSNDTSTGYYGSYMFQTTLGLGTSGAVYNQIANAFGTDFLLSHRELLCNVVSNGNPSGWVWHSTKISIMNQAQILGQKMWMGGPQDARNLGVSNSQFQLFKIAHQFIPLSPRGSFWLRDIISINDFVYIINNGTPYNGGGSKASLGVRPYFCLKGA